MGDDPLKIRQQKLLHKKAVIIPRHIPPKPTFQYLKSNTVFTKLDFIVFLLFYFI